MIVVEIYSQSTKTQQIVVPSNCAKIHRTKILVPSKQTTQQSAKLWYTHGKHDPTIGPKNNLYWDKTEDILQNIILVPSEQKKHHDQLNYDILMENLIQRLEKGIKLHWDKKRHTTKHQHNKTIIKKRSENIPQI